VEVAPWKHADVSMTTTFKNKMWFMGGWYNGRLPGCEASNEVWSSSNGVNWELVTEHAQWSPRMAAALVEFKGKLWMMGGTEIYHKGNDKNIKNDVWSSIDGKTWELVNPNAEWSPRAFHQAVVFNGQIYLFGGGNYQPKYFVNKDVWSSKDGIHWKKVTNSVPWHGRLWFSSAVYRNRMWVLGGWSNNPDKNWGDVWHSKNGKDWKELKTKQHWSPRHEHSTYVFKDKLIVAGGSTGRVVNEVWSLFIDKDW